jgi:hypothetical protein
MIRVSSPARCVSGGMSMGVESSPSELSHTLRHGYGTHAAMFGVNPWKLMQWMGRKRIDETMLYVHFAEAHMRPLPEPIRRAQQGHDDPRSEDRRDARCAATLLHRQPRGPWQNRGKDRRRD